MVKWWKPKPGAHQPVEAPAEAEARFRRENPVERVCAGLRDTDPEVRRDAARKLARLRDAKAVHPLCEALGEELNQSSRYYRFSDYATEEIIEALAAIGGPEAENLLCSLLKKEAAWSPIPVDIRDEPDIDAVTEWLAPALVELGGVDLLLRGLLDALADERSRIREHAAEELANITYRAMDDGGYVTLSGDGVLTNSHRASIFGPLCSALEDEQASVRERAVVALGHLGNMSALDRMLTCLHDENDRVRYFAANALGDLGDVRAIKSLRQCTKDPEVAVAAEEALAKLMRR